MQVITEYTRHEDFNTLWFICVSYKFRATDHDNVDLMSLTYHMMVYLTNDVKPGKGEPETRTNSDFKNFCDDYFQQDCERTNWQLVKALNT